MSRQAYQNLVREAILSDSDFKRSFRTHKQALEEMNKNIRAWNKKVRYKWLMLKELWSLSYLYVLPK